MKPVRLPASATLALPRWGLVSLCLLYILPGLIRRDPWKSDDVAGFGIMWTMAHGSLQDWLLPNIAGMPMPEEGPLAFWIGALCIKLFSWAMDEALAARMSTIVFFLVGALAVWYGTYLLGRRGDAQPLRLAFGGQPEIRDYGRTLADGALLIYLGCLGLLLRSHETSAEALQVSLLAVSLYGAIRLFDSGSKRGAATLGVTLGLLALTRGFVLPLMLATCFLLLALMMAERQVLRRLLLVSFPLALAILGAWFLVLKSYSGAPANVIPDWIQWNAGQFGMPSGETLVYLVRNAFWYAWPAWPFAAWAVYAWRKQSPALHVMLPLVALAGMVLLALANPHSEESILLPLLPPLAILAAFGLPTMKRGAINAVDWFSVMTLSTCAAFIWIGWIAKQTGWPAQLARNALRLAPGYKPEFNGIAFLIAACATAAWIWLVHWRIARRPSVLWRAVVLSSGGVILCWLLLMTLWLPWLNYGKSYAGVARQIAGRLPQQQYCVDSNVGPAQRASFAYFGHVNFAHPRQDNCQFLLLQDSLSRRNSRQLLQSWGGEWKLLWEGRRPSDRDERFRLYQRTSP